MKYAIFDTSRDRTVLLLGPFESIASADTHYTELMTSAQRYRDNARSIRVLETCVWHSKEPRKTCSQCSAECRQVGHNFKWQVRQPTSEVRCGRRGCKAIA